MATTIKIKRGGATSETAPDQLAAGELALTYGDAAAQNNDGNRLFVGNSDASANLIIGGKYFADLMDHVHGTLTASSALIADSNSKLNDLKVDNLELNGNIISSTDTNGEVTLKPHGTGSVGIAAANTATAGKLKFYEGSTNGSNSISFTSPAALGATTDFILPSGDGTAGQVLGTDGSGNLDWKNQNVRVGVTGANEIDTSSGNLTIDSDGGTVTIDDNLTISGSMTIDMGANKVTNVADPTSAQDSATKAYVDATKSGLDVKDSVSVATTADVTSWTYNNGAGTLTASGNGAVSLDSVALTLNMRVLVKNQDPATENGIYYVSTAGAGGATLVLTRATDATPAAELTGGTFVFVEQGTIGADNGYVFTHDGTPTFGSTNLTVSQFSGAGQISDGAGITKSGNTLAVEADDTTVKVISDAVSVVSSGTQYQVLRSTGSTSAAAAWGQIDLSQSNAVTGVAAIANGGTGASSLTQNRMLMANGTNALTVLGAGTSGQVMLSAGASAPAFGDIDGGTF